MNMQVDKLVSRNLTSVLGLPFDNVTTDDVVEKIRECCLTGTRCFLTTPNLNFAITASSDNEFFNSVVASDLSIADGMPIVLLARLIGEQLPERVAGSTVFESLSSTSATERKLKVFFFGGQPGVAEKAHNKLNESSQGLEACGWHDPGFVSVEDMSNHEIIEMINAAAPDFLVLALGARKGQEWLMRNRHALRVPVISHLGAVINFVAGEVSRAPRLVQKLGFEWLWRIKEEPSLWRRYWSDGIELIKCLVHQVLPLAVVRFLERSRPNKSKSSRQVNFQQSDQGFTVVCSGFLDDNALQEVKQRFYEILCTGSNITLNLTEATSISQQWIGFLLALQRNLADRDRCLFMQLPSQRIMRIFRYSNVLKRFHIIDSSEANAEFNV